MLLGHFDLSEFESLTGMAFSSVGDAFLDHYGKHTAPPSEARFSVNTLKYQPFANKSSIKQHFVWPFRLGFSSCPGASPRNGEWRFVTATAPPKLICFSQDIHELRPERITSWRLMAEVPIFGRSEQDVLIEIGWNAKRHPKHYSIKIISTLISHTWSLCIHLFPICFGTICCNKNGFWGIPKSGSLYSTRVILSMTATWSKSDLFFSWHFLLITYHVCECLWLWSSIAVYLLLAIVSSKQVMETWAASCIAFIGWPWSAKAKVVRWRYSPLLLFMAWAWPNFTQPRQLPDLHHRKGPPAEWRSGEGAKEWNDDEIAEIRWDMLRWFKANFQISATKGCGPVEPSLAKRRCGRSSLNIADQKQETQKIQFEIPHQMDIISKQVYLPKSDTLNQKSVDQGLGSTRQFPKVTGLCDFRIPARALGEC